MESKSCAPLCPRTSRRPECNSNFRKAAFQRQESRAIVGAYGVCWLRYLAESQQPACLRCGYANCKVLIDICTRVGTTFSRVRNRGGKFCGKPFVCLFLFFFFCARNDRHAAHGSAAIGLSCLGNALPFPSLPFMTPASMSFVSLPKSFEK